MPEVNLFYLYRYFLSAFVCCYAIVQLAVFLWRFQQFGADDPRGMGLVRKYFLVQLLRVRLHRFLVELVSIGVLSGVLLWLVSLHWRWDSLRP